MIRHLKRTHGEARFPCQYCQKKFGCKKRLQEHEAIHLGIPLYTCEFCQAEFKSAGNFCAHKRRLHSNEYAEAKAKNLAKRYELN